MVKFDLDKFLGEYVTYRGVEDAGNFKHIVNNLGHVISGNMELGNIQRADELKSVLRRYINLLDKNSGFRESELTNFDALGDIPIKDYISKMEKKLEGKNNFI